MGSVNQDINFKHAYSTFRSMDLFTNPCAESSLKLFFGVGIRIRLSYFEVVCFLIISLTTSAFPEYYSTFFQYFNYLINIYLLFFSFGFVGIGIYFYK